MKATNSFRSSDHHLHLPFDHPPQPLGQLLKHTRVKSRPKSQAAMKQQNGFSSSRFILASIYDTNK